MKSFYKNNEGSIQNRLFISYFILIVTIIGLVGATVYMISQNILESEVGKSRVKVLDQISRNIGVIIDEITSVSNLFNYNEELMDIIKKPTETVPSDRYVTDNRLRELTNRYIFPFESFDFNYNTVVYSFAGRRYNNYSSESYNFDVIPNAPWYDNVVKGGGKIVWLSTFNDKYNYSNEPDDMYVFSAAKLLVDDVSRAKLGILLVNVDHKLLYSTYENADDSDNDIFIIDSKGNVVSDRDTSIIGNNLSNRSYISKIIAGNTSGSLFVKRNGKKIMVTYQKIDRPGWVLIEEVPVDILLKPMDYLKYLTTAMLLVFVLVGLVFSYGIAKRITSPIKSLCFHMKELGEGNLDVVSKERGMREVIQLNDGFNRMVARINELMASVRKEEKLKRRAEIDFLQAQINPHFLYNTLFSIKCTIAMGNGKPAENMLQSLISLLKKTLGNEDEFITVEEEINCLKDYIGIQSFRYPERFDITYAIESGIMKCLIPKLLLQPLVENAIFHGLEPKEGKGVIIIEGSKVNDDMVFNIIDNGMGMDAEAVRNVWEKGRPASTMAHNHIGIRNVHDRVVLNFGENYGISIESTPGNGTRVEVRMPCITGQRSEIEDA